MAAGAGPSVKPAQIRASMADRVGTLEQRSDIAHKGAQQVSGALLKLAEQINILRMDLNMEPLSTDYYKDE